MIEYIYDIYVYDIYIFIHIYIFGYIFTSKKCIFKVLRLI